MRVLKAAPIPARRPLETSDKTQPGRTGKQRANGVLVLSPAVTRSFAPDASLTTSSSEPVTDSGEPQFAGSTGKHADRQLFESRAPRDLSPKHDPADAPLPHERNGGHRAFRGPRVGANPGRASALRDSRAMVRPRPRRSPAVSAGNASDPATTAPTPQNPR